MSCRGMKIRSASRSRGVLFGGLLNSAFFQTAMLGSEAGRSIFKQMSVIMFDHAQLEGVRLGQVAEFDSAYLAGLYKMPRNNRRTGLHSAVVHVY